MTDAPLVTSSSRGLRIAVVGMGGIGSAFAFQLARTGHHDITAIARPGSARLEQLRRMSGVINTKGEHAPMRVTDTLDGSIPYDLVLVTLPAHLVAPLVPALRRSTATRIQFMFNIFEPEQLRDKVGAERCSFGMPFIQASLSSTGELRAKIGVGGQKTKIDRAEAVSLFSAAGLPAVLEAEMLLWLRCHVPLCAAFESVSVAAMRRGGGASWKEAQVIASGLQEGLSLVQRLGFRLYPVGKARLQSAPLFVPALLLWVMSRIPSFRELLSTGLQECEALVEVMVSEADRVLQPATVSRIKAMKPTGT